MAQKSVLITGTSTGIGAAAAQRMAEAGWKVYAGVRKADDGERLAASIDGDVVPLILDVTERDQIERALETIDNEVGSLNGLVNNAGIGVGGPVELVTDDDWRWQFEVNFFSLVTMTRLAMPLVDKGDGRFVHIGSIAGRVAAGGLGPYAASKHAVEGFNWALRAELGANTKMSSSVVEPGEIKTAIWDKAQSLLTEMEAAVDAAGRQDRYELLLDAQRGFIADGAKRGIDADKVAKAVEHALTARRPKARYLVGPDARVAGLVASLPDRVREPFMNFNTKRMAKAGKQLA
jgi:NAD(P)-dependent dehydrogenase (short-subunit alcohol dehydrogenase family)